jgi:hypothetical protein
MMEDMTLIQYLDNVHDEKTFVEFIGAMTKDWEDMG